MNPAGYRRRAAIWFKISYENSVEAEENAESFDNIRNTLNEEEVSLPENQVGADNTQVNVDDTEDNVDDTQDDADDAQDNVDDTRDNADHTRDSTDDSHDTEGLSAELSEQAEELQFAEVEDQIMVGSMLPIREEKAFLLLNGKSEEELKNMSLDVVLSNIVDSNGNLICIDPAATTVWRYEKDELNNVDEYKKYHIGKSEIIDLSNAKSVTDYQLELVVGSGNQLNSNNKRYIINVYISNTIGEEFSFELYTQDDNSRRKIDAIRVDFSQSDSEDDKDESTNDPLDIKVKALALDIPIWRYVYVVEEGTY